MDMNLRKLWEIVEDRRAYSPWGCEESNAATEQQRLCTHSISTHKTMHTCNTAPTHGPRYKHEHTTRVPMHTCTRDTFTHTGASEQGNRRSPVQPLPSHMETWEPSEVTDSCRCRWPARRRASNGSWKTQGSQNSLTLF